MGNGPIRWDTGRDCMLKDKSILLGVSGGIAAYKAAEIVRCFVKAQAAVQVVMTANAREFITPLTLQALSGRPVLTNLFDLEHESRIGHIEAARRADLVVLAPATANLMAKMASGIADDYLTTILLATTAPVLVCPAMNVKMFEHPATQRNLSTLRELGCHVLPPAVGSLACREEGTGRLADIPDILEASRRLLTAPSLAGRRILVSAGPTWEPFDPVRFISNPSTGKMGYALATVAARRSGEVHLVSGPSTLAAPQGVRLSKVVTAREMQESVLALAPGMDAIVMAAAVSDFRPTEEAPQKIKKIAGEEAVRLTRNPDILAALGRSRPGGRHQVLVGFAAETENLIENAREKLIEKNLDFIVANNLTQSGSGFGSDTNQVKILDRDGTITELPCLTKEEVAEMVMDRVEQQLGKGEHDDAVRED
ncbi:Phosphopantothenate-cysteine ligase / Phosphopantothenoylcysteine decarboxylase [Syntrophobacter fumaroxidans MPOB]|uniref:Coenzyme A biosynthesis bifunctional protein CoaBC n=2 Tax=Syntrophobacter TaxID=29526 RepID=A0LFG5_SYNFM|nr:Phosphopantothenate-cysteine ligase / Phosphopantothenoylcysteine decarboxylase [Syntrophobacter fumaroxidans MPOB]